MTVHDKTATEVVKILNSDERLGIKNVQVKKQAQEFGQNKLTEKKEKSLVGRIVDCVKEPMMLILLFSFVITFGINLGKLLKSGSADFSECLGVLGAVVLSVGITLIMEGNSKKAFKMLNSLYDSITVKCVRDGKIISVSNKEVVVGDVIILEAGDKIIADGRLIESDELTVDESALTGESVASKKDANKVCNISVPLAERKNCVYSGTFVCSGSGKMIVCAVGDKTEIGSIAGELLSENTVSSPLQTKLNKLGKTVTVTGVICAVVVFVLSIIKMALNKTLSFNGVQEQFVSCIILIVAAVPEGLPTIVAVSLALNMIKLAGENALIKKMSATETTGAVSVICSDKTGTITMNKMSVNSICVNKFCYSPENLSEKFLIQNFVLNSTAEIVVKGKEKAVFGSPTECALLEVYNGIKGAEDYKKMRERFKVKSREQFSSDKKYMTTTVETDGVDRQLIKGAPEKILKECALSIEQIESVNQDIIKHQKKARRVICFAHRDIINGNVKPYIYDGFVAISDPIRPQVKKAVSDCKRAGIKVKMLTGDNIQTAYAIASELDLVRSFDQVANASDLENLNEEDFKKAISHIVVIARSTPSIKLRVVRALKSMGEVVALTGDGINDAPAIRHADVGIAMGISGSEITKEASDIVLLDDSFATVIKAIEFGRNVYKNLQRFILFQLSVNLSALLLIILCAITEMPSPFNTLELLWINIIMDGPPALTLGFEKATDSLMKCKPVKRNEHIVNLKMLLRIVFNSGFMGLVCYMQARFNFLGVKQAERSNCIFTLFILFQLCNAFNCRELGAKSIFSNLGKNKIMAITFSGVFVLHLFFVQVLPNFFGVQKMSALCLLKCIAVSVSVIAISELYKLIFRLMKNSENGEKSLLPFEKVIKKGAILNKNSKGA